MLQKLGNYNETKFTYSLKIIDARVNATENLSMRNVVIGLPISG